MGTIGGNLLLESLSYLLKKPKPKRAREIFEIYESYGIETDLISNFTTLYGIKLYEEEGEHPAFCEFVKKYEYFLVGMFNLREISRADCDSKKIFVVENNMVFSKLCENLKGEDVGIICTSGQPNMATLQVIDMLVESGCIIYYSGDMDPEGIGIAERILSMGEHIYPWHYEVKDYEKYISNVEISKARLKKLERIKSPYFKELLEVMKKKKRAAYQEEMLEEMEKDMRG